MRETRKITIRVSEDTYQTLRQLTLTVRSQKYQGPLNRDADVEAMLTYVAGALEDGWERRGSWEADVNRMLFGI